MENNNEKRDGSCAAPASVEQSPVERSDAAIAEHNLPAIFHLTVDTNAPVNDAQDLQAALTVHFHGWPTYSEVKWLREHMTHVLSVTTQGLFSDGAGNIWPSDSPPYAVSLKHKKAVLLSTLEQTAAAYAHADMAALKGDSALASKLRFDALNELINNTALRLSQMPGRLPVYGSVKLVFNDRPNAAVRYYLIDSIKSYLANRNERDGTERIITSIRWYVSFADAVGSTPIGAEDMDNWTSRSLAIKGGARGTTGGEEHA